VSDDKKTERANLALDEALKKRIDAHRTHLEKSGLALPEAEVLRQLLRKGLDVVEAERKHAPLRVR